ARIGAARNVLNTVEFLIALRPRFEEDQCRDGSTIIGHFPCGEQHSAREGKSAFAPRKHVLSRSESRLKEDNRGRASVRSLQPPAVHSGEFAGTGAVAEQAADDRNAGPCG